jgi:hypothetical protein
MLKHISLALFLCAPSLIAAQTAPSSISADRAASDIYKMAAPSVVLIQTYDDSGKVTGAGSGFLVSADGRIITNFHVIAHTKRATVRLANGDAYDTVSVLDVDKRKDIALLKIKAVALPFLKLAQPNPVQVGDKVYTLGNPLGVYQNTLSDGILSGVRQMDGFKILQMSAPISHGSSGSPVFDAHGNVVGIAEALVAEGENINFAIPIDYALGLMDSNQPQPLSAFYEPPATNGTPAVRTTSVSQPTATPSLKQDVISYIATKMGVWTKEDAVAELGQPTDRRDATANNAVFGDIYKFQSPNQIFASVEVCINRNTHKVQSAYFYYANLVPWKAVEQQLGKNYQEQKTANGRPMYLYQFQNRTVSVLVDSADNVFNIGLW